MRKLTIYTLTTIISFFAACNQGAFAQWVSGGTTQGITSGNKQIRWNFGASGFVYGYTKAQVDSLFGVGHGVTSFNGRTGAVTFQSSDGSPYYPLLTGSYANPSWITSLSYGKLTGAPDLSVYKLKNDSTASSGFTTRDRFDNVIGAAALARINTLGGGLSKLNYQPQQDYSTPETTPATISTTNYDAFGRLDQFKSGKYILYTRQGASHVGGDASIIARYSTNGKDFTAPVTLLAGAGIDYRNLGGGLTSTGRLFIFYEKYIYGTGINQGMGYIYTDDDGVTWSTPTILFSGSYAAFGKLIIGENNELMLPFYGTGNKSYTTISTNNGASWSAPALLSDSTIIQNETSIVYLSGGTYLAAVRTPPDESGFTMYMLTSGDSTWVKTGLTTFDGAGTKVSPEMVVTLQPNGKKAVTLFYPNRSTGLLMAISGLASNLINNGASGWDANTLVTVANGAITNSNFGYPSVVHPNNSSYLLGYYYLGNDSITQPYFFTYSPPNLQLTGTGIVKSTAGAISYITDNSPNWDIAYSQKRQWDGGATGLVASTGRASLGLVIGTDVLAQRTFGTAANNNTSDFYSSTNPNGYISSYTETDPTVPAYAKSLTAFSVIQTSTDALYATKTGSGATGTWGINISGNAATADNSTLWNGYSNRFSEGVYNAGDGLVIQSILAQRADGVSYQGGASLIKAFLNLSGTNTGDETTARINALYGYTPANGANYVATSSLNMGGNSNTVAQRNALGALYASSFVTDASINAGFLYLGSNQSHYLYWDGTNYGTSIGAFGSNAYNSTAFLTANQLISFTPTGDVTGSTSGTTALVPVLTIGAGKVTNTMLAGGIDLATKVTGVLPSANSSVSLLASFYTLTGNSGTTPTDIYSYTIPANTLSADGDFIDGSYTLAVGVQASTIDNIEINFAGQTVANFGPFSHANASDGIITIVLKRISSSDAQCSATWLDNGGSVNTGSVDFDLRQISSVNFTTTNVLKVIATGGSTNSIAFYDGYYRLNK